MKSELAIMLTMAAMLPSTIHIANAGTLVVVEYSSVPRLSEYATLEGCDTNGTSFTNIRDVCRNRPKIEFN
ncbi:MAG: hypothetical protein ACJ72C_06970 [Nitrososphaeraceae archaeon]